MLKKIIFLMLFVLMFSPLCIGRINKKSYQAIIVQDSPPHIDGKIAEGEWDSVQWSGEFIQRIPYDGKTPTFDTNFKILFDKNNLYIVVKSFDKNPEKIVKRISRRDDMDGDWICIELDSYNDGKTAFSFAVNAAGVRRDITITEDGNNQDINWDPVWEVKTGKIADGWIAELKIPFDQLRFASTQEQVWGLQVSRFIHRMEENSNWQHIPRNASGWVHHFGKLRGIKDVRPGSRLKILPYTVGKSMNGPSVNNATGSNQKLNFGIDGKYSLTSDITLNFTINPDFGQVEADPSEINLTTFETYFSEKRPFFIEGNNIMDFRVMKIGDGTFSMDKLFYSRRIGRRPQNYPETSDDENLDIPQNTAILGAVKITGKTKSGLSLGILDSITSSENAFMTGPLGLRSENVEPLTNYFLIRLQQDINDGNTTFGGMFTATNRDINAENLDFLHTSAYTAGFDFTQNFKDKSYNIMFNMVFSSVSGSREAISSTQQSPLRYFQKPDADHLSYDPDLTSLSGHGGMLSFGKFGNGDLRFWTGVTWRSPGLELNDMGYLRQSDVIMQWVWANYRIAEPFWIFRSLSFNFNEWMGFNFGGENIFSGGNFGISGQLKNYFWINYSLNLQGFSLSPSTLRGGPSLYVGGGLGHGISFSTDSRKKLRFGVSVFTAQKGVDDILTSNYSLSFNYKPTNALSISLRPFFNTVNRKSQYVNTIEQSDQNRYLVGSLDQDTYGITIRLNYSINPNMSLQFYGQPFIATGKFSAFKEVLDSRAPEFNNRYTLLSGDQINQLPDGNYTVDHNLDGIVDYDIENADFRLLEFRSNLVFRWEYHPGSTLYLVWSQGRSIYSSDYSTSMSSNFNDLFSLESDNVFLLKMTYQF